MSSITTNVDATGAPEEVVTFARSAFVGATITLGLIGGLTAAYGTILIGIAGHFRLPIATAGLTLTANFFGAIIGVAACWRALRRWSGAWVWGGALALLSGGLGLAATAPTWVVFVGAVTIAGAGLGALDFAMVALVARTAREGLAARLSVSGSGWAFGAVAGPLVIVIIRPQHYAWLLALGAVLGVGLLLLCRGVVTPPARVRSRTAVLVERVPNRREVLVTFAAALGLYVAVESATSGWLSTQLHGWGYTTVVGASVTAGFWAGLAIGRVGLAPAMSRVAAHWFVLVGLAAAIALLVVASDRSLALYAYPLVGFALAAVFPVGLHWFTELSPNDHDGVAWLVVADMAGGALGTGIENVAVADIGLHVVPWVAAGLGVACVLVFASALRFSAVVEPGALVSAGP